VKDEGAVISVFDMLGRQVVDSHRVDTNNEMYVLGADALSSGYYVVKVQTGSQVKSAPVVIAH
jgi:hypothetical protein